MTIEALNIFKSYSSLDHPKGLRILNSLSLNVEAGEFVSLMGPSGCGKSTLLSLLYGLDQPDQGSIKILNTDLSSLKGNALTSFRANSIGMIFQQFHLLPFLTALENIMMPLNLRGATDTAQAHFLMENLNIENRKDHYPHQLSRGECQRVAIARALILKPQLLLADEPTGSLDQKTALHVLELLKSLLTPLKTSFLLVTHDPKMTTFCHRHLRFEEGTLVDL